MLNLIRRTVIEFVDIDEEMITEETYFIRDLHLTSYDVVSIIGKIEDDLGVEIPDREIRDLETVGDLIKYLSNKIT